MCLTNQIDQFENKRNSSIILLFNVKRDVSRLNFKINIFFYLSMLCL